MFDAGKLRSVESLSSAGQSSRAAEVGRVVGYSWNLMASFSIATTPRCRGGHYSFSEIASLKMQSVKQGGIK